MNLSSLVARVAGSLLSLISASALGGSIRYEFTGGSLAPVLTGIPAGVQVGDFVIGKGFSGVDAAASLAALRDEGSSPDGLRITGSDRVPDTTGASVSAETTFRFSITIPAGVTMNLASLSLDYKGTTPAGSRSNARVYSNLRPRTNATNDTIGIVGSDNGGTDAGFITDTFFFASPVGSNISAVDFKGLTGRTVTFEIPWMDALTAASDFIDIDRVTLVFDPLPPAVTDFRMTGQGSSQLTFTGESGQPYAVMASEDLIGPIYRKRWTRLTQGTFDGSPVVYPDPTAALSPKKFYVVAPALEPVVRIMPVGDSITEGNVTTFSVYREPLFDRLKAAGYRFEYVGSKSTTYQGNTLRYEAYSGADATYVAGQVAAHFAASPADIVMIHAGHNFDLGSRTESQIIGLIETATRSMITTCRTVNPKVIVLLAQVITSPKPSDVKGSTAIKYGYIPALNLRLAEVAAELNTAAQPVIVVNQAEGWNTATDAYTDQVHPNATGAGKMAGKWFDALVPLLE